MTCTARTLTAIGDPVKGPDGFFSQQYQAGLCGAPSTQADPLRCEKHAEKPVPSLFVVLTRRAIYDFKDGKSFVCGEGLVRLYDMYFTSVEEARKAMADCPAEKGARVFRIEAEEVK